MPGMSILCIHNQKWLANSTTGFHSQVSRLPYDNLGVAVLTNDHEFGVQIREIIKFRILDTLLGLQPADFNAA